MLKLRSSSVSVFQYYRRVQQDIRVLSVEFVALAFSFFCCKRVSSFITDATDAKQRPLPLFLEV